ncbi:hypothetical protein N9K16_01595 [Alphaproteobacteria bacterium]|nr:hypothetical protein [Alphaproteobacteria bacterium]
MAQARALYDKVDGTCPFYDIYWKSYKSHGRSGRLTDLEQVAQRVKTRLLMFKEEWFLDEREGMPWFQDILVKPMDQGFVESEMKRIILETEGVEKLTTFSLDYDSIERRLEVEFSAESIYGSLVEVELGDFPILGSEVSAFLDTPPPLPVKPIFIPYDDPADLTGSVATFCADPILLEF